MLLLDENGAKIGLVPTASALDIARERGLDLVQVQDGPPPVAKIMSYSHYKYTQQRKERAQAKATRQSSHLHQVRLRTTIDEHDYATKLALITKFLRKGDRVQVTVVSKGRMAGKPELAQRLLERTIDELKHVGKPGPQAVGAREARVTFSPNPDS